MNETDDSNLSNIETHWHIHNSMSSHPYDKTPYNGRVFTLDKSTLFPYNLNKKKTKCDREYSQLCTASNNKVELARAFLIELLYLCKFPNSISYV